MGSSRVAVPLLTRNQMNPGSIKYRWTSRADVLTNLCACIQSAFSERRAPIEASLCRRGWNGKRNEVQVARLGIV
jgi:hypothetical protein